MRTPVLIAARNEAHIIGKTLGRLPDNVEPIVIPNGCEDNTAGIARTIGATVLEGSPEGKMLALQMGIRYLGRRATEPFITLDADSQPLFSSQWLPTMLKSLTQQDTDIPEVVIGPFIYKATNPVASAWRTFGHWRNLIKTRDDTSVGAFGRNMLLDLKTDQHVERLLSLPHFWPSEDVAIKDEVLLAGGCASKSLHPLGIVLTESDRFPSIKKRMKIGAGASTKLIRDSYLAEAPPQSTPYQKPDIPLEHS